MDIKDIIANYRRENGISQREFARRCDLSNSLVSILEMGVNPQTGKKISPDLITYKKLANGMGISAQQLMESLDNDAHVALVASAAFGAIDDSDKPKTIEARILAKGIDKLPQEQREQALSVIKAMFAKYSDYFEKENDDEP